MSKQLVLNIPESCVVPEILSSFSPDENWLMIKIGSESIKEGRNAAINLSHKEIYDKVKSETKVEVQKLESDILIHKGVNQQLEEKMSKIYEAQILKMEKTIEFLSNKLNDYEIIQLSNKEIIDKEVENALVKVKQDCDLLLQQKDRQIDKFSDIYEKMLIQSHKSTSHKGSDGEKQFEEYASTFIDFKGFDIIDKHTQGGSGDFHLHFEEFDVLVDAKNYKKKVPVDQREKIKKDLIKNEHLHFGWLVSLNTSIDKYDKAPVMYEWINTKQCLVYINNLAGFEDPKKILRIVWFTCKELYDMTREVYFDEEELTQLKDDRFKFMDKVRNLRKNIREINTSINATKNLIQFMDDELKGMLDSETNEIVSSNFSLFDDWWNQNIESASEDSIVVSTDLWFKFKQENKDLIKEFELNTEKFKQFIKTKVSLSNITIKSKNANSAFDIKGIRILSNSTNSEKNSLQIDKVELNEEVINKKRIVKKK